MFFTAEGEFTTNELLSCLKEVVSHPDFKPGYRHLVDLRNLYQFSARSDDLQQRVEDDKKMVDKLGDSMIAMVSSGQYTYGMTLIYKTLMDSPTCKVKTFRDITKARKWLGVPDDPAPS